VDECAQTNDGILELRSRTARISTHRTTSTALSDLVAELPEVYQPILGHPELCLTISRRCDDRLAHIVSVHRALERGLARPLRVLDLGCAQGFFSLSLSQLGAQVHGVDFLEANIAVCRALAAERGDRGILFETARIEDVLSRLEVNRYDLILGLSVFHHLVQTLGTPPVRGMLAAAGFKVAAVLFEIAVAEEPIHWAAAQPRSARELLSEYAFVHEIAHHGTHISEVRRPLFFASNRHWYLDGRAGVFDRWTTESNAAVPKVHQGTRRFYFSDKQFISQFRLDDKVNREQNLLEWENAVAFLKNPPTGLKVPRLESWGRNDTEAWLVRELLPGTTLATHIAEGYRSYDPDRVLRDILSQLQALEATGLYHQDLRTWNIIIDTTGGASLIDYGAISKSREDCTWPNDVFLSFLIFMREVLVGAQEFPVPDRTGCFNPDRLPEPYRQTIWRMLYLPFKKWRFAYFLQNIETEQGGDDPTTIDCGNASLLFEAWASGVTDLRSQIAKMEVHAASYDKLIASLEIPNAPLSLKIVLPLARMIRKLRNAVLGG
jgi:SAM-dependent methyltransferase